jgi:hypothetical protein
MTRAIKKSAQIKPRGQLGSEIYRDAYAYGRGCVIGGALAKEWKKTKAIRSPSYGGTLQYVVLDLARRYADAADQFSRSEIVGEIVGFCYELECPEDAENCRLASRVTISKKAAGAK